MASSRGSSGFRPFAPGLVAGTVEQLGSRCGSKRAGLRSGRRGVCSRVPADQTGPHRNWSSSMTTSATSHRGRKSDQIAWAKQPVTASFDTGDTTLLIPLESMWDVRNASLPSAVFRRAQLPPTLWTTWEERYARDWQPVRNWLYHDGELPQGISSDPAMHAFREQSTRAAIASDSERSDEEMALMKPGKRRRSRDVDPRGFY